LDEVIDQIREDLLSKGYLEVRIEREEKRIRPNFRRILIRIYKSYQYRLREPEFIGLNNPEKILSIFRRTRGIQAGKHFNEDEFRRIFEEEFFKELLKEGYAGAKVRTLEFSIDRSTASVQPIIYMNEGPRYLIDEAHISGVPPEFHKISSYENLEKAISQ